LSVVLDAALDLVDTFGPYPKDWPAAQRPAIEALERSNAGFADHLKEMRELEDQLSCWEDADDGVDMCDQPDVAAAGVDDDGAGLDPIVIDPSAIVDMDEMLAKFIERTIAEFDEPYRVFTKDLDALTEIPTRGATLDNIQLATQQAVGPLQRELTRLIAARTQATRLPGQRRGKIHAANLHRILSGDGRVFSRKQEAPALDTAITLLIDCSGSMTGGYHQGAKGKSWSDTPMVLAVRAAYALGTVLARINVPFEVIGYTTGQRAMDQAYLDEVQAAHEVSPVTRYTPLSYPAFKQFHEPFSLEIQRRFGALHDSQTAVSMGGTIEGCSVEFAARRLLAQPAKRKLMIVLSDGKPMGAVYQDKRKKDQGFSFGGSSVPYMKHAREMVQEVTAAGIDLVGVGIKYAEMKSYYPNALVIDNVAEMPAKLMGVLKRFLIN
jgi:cobalamin biosynthesis protein CobT